MSSTTSPHTSKSLVGVPPPGYTTKLAFLSFLSGAALSAACFYLYLVLAGTPVQQQQQQQQQQSIGCIDGTLVTPTVDGCVTLFLDTERVVCSGDTLQPHALATVVGLTSVTWADWLYISLRGQARKVDVSEGIVILTDEGCDAEEEMSLNCEELFEWKDRLNELPLLNLTSCEDLSLVQTLFLAGYDQERWLHYCDKRMGN